MIAPVTVLCRRRKTAEDRIRRTNGPASAMTIRSAEVFIMTEIVPSVTNCRNTCPALRRRKEKKDTGRIKHVCVPSKVVLILPAKPRVAPAIRRADIRGRGKLQLHRITQPAYPSCARQHNQRNTHLQHRDCPKARPSSSLGQPGRFADVASHARHSPSR